MPGGRRIAGRHPNPRNLGISPPPKPDVTRRGGSGAESPDAGAANDPSRGAGAGGPLNGLATLVVVPRYTDIPLDGNVFFELLLLAYCLVALGLQYVNIYRTVWWIPNSYNSYALSFYLIDDNLVLFLAAFMARRLVWTFVFEVTASKSMASLSFWLVPATKLALVLSFSSVLCYSLLQILLKYFLQNSLYVLYLLFPVVPYLILFGSDFLEIACHLLTEGFGSPKWTVHVLSICGFNEIDSTDLQRRALLGLQMRTSPDSVRAEVTRMRDDFNTRLKYILFTSMLCAYYVGLIPCCFAQSFVHYDTFWAAQQTFVVWVNTMLLLAAHQFPPPYCDWLHRVALHLGSWRRLENRNVHIPYHQWSDLQIWPKNVLVKHVRGLFRSEGQQNSAEPGNHTHGRFYLLFHEPLRILHCMLTVTFIMIFHQLVILLVSVEWNHVLAISLLLFSNYYILFKLLRDRMVLKKAYKDAAEGSGGGAAAAFGVSGSPVGASGVSGGGMAAGAIGVVGCGPVAENGRGGGAGLAYLVPQHGTDGGT